MKIRNRANFIMFIIILFFGVSLSKEILYKNKILKEQKEKKAQVEDKLKELKLQKQEIILKKQNSFTDESIEKKARELGYIKEDEKIFIEKNMY